MFFKDIIGQNEIKQQLLRSVKDGYIPHARLIAGAEGVGKLAMAIAYAQYLCCTDRSEDDSCGKCPSCLKFKKLTHPDLHFIYPIINKKKSSSKELFCDDLLPEWREMILKNPYFNYNQWLDFIGAENSQGLIYARESDEIIRKLNLKAYEAEYKIMLVWLPEKMHEACANKLLKMIEEPPAKTVFLLVSEMPDMIIGTIQSRTQRLHVPPIDANAMKEALVNVAGQTLNDADTLVHIANGNYLRLLELLENHNEKSECLELFISMMRCCRERNVKQMRAYADTFASMGRERQKAFLSYAGNYIRENFFYRLNLPEINYINREEQTFSNKFSPYVNEQNVIDLTAEFDLAERHIEANVNPRMIFFDLSMKIAVLIKRSA
ncbi:MAG: DNA polymerase III subunit delta [Dysgonamonadaceae bacterium]|jgi:DNA polymerase-3 subunit delta'|nr:DNA polymerase III subunit delta [Dysgonamonadaceae bacterium]